MKTVKREFHGDEIPLDFNKYQDCTFVDCTLVYHGYTEPVLDNCMVQGCSLSYQGPAGRALAWLAAQKNSTDPANINIADSLLTAANLPT